MTGPCRECRVDADLIEGICIDCIYRLADRGSKISKEDIQKIRDEVQKETAGLIPHNILRSILEAALAAQDAGSPEEEIVEEAANEIQRLGGLGMCREMAKIAEGFRSMSADVTRGLEETALSIDEEVRRKVRILSNLPRKAR